MIELQRNSTFDMPSQRSLTLIRSRKKEVDRRLDVLTLAPCSEQGPMVLGGSFIVVKIVEVPE